MSYENSPLESTKAEIDELKGAIKKLSTLKEHEYQLQRKSIAKQLGVQVSFLDKEVSRAWASLNITQEEVGVSVDALTLAPCDEPADGMQVHQDMTNLVNRYMYLSDKRIASVIALWCQYTHALDAFRIAPKLLITAPDMACGKSTLVEIVAALSCRCEAMVGVSPAIIYRLIEKYNPTMAFDEVDNMRNGPGFDEITAIMNAGHKRGSYVWRCTGDNHEPTRFPIFAPQIIAMIGKPKRTTVSRSIVVKLDRATRAESQVLDDISDIEPMVNWLPLRERALRWGLDLSDELRKTPVKPVGVYGRVWDNWRPLLRVAEVLGDDDLLRLTREMCLEEVGGVPNSDAQSRTWDAIYSACLSYWSEHPGEKNIRSEDLYKCVVSEGSGLQRKYPDHSSLSRFVSPFINTKPVRVSFYEKPRKGWEVKKLLAQCERYSSNPIAAKKQVTELQCNVPLGVGSNSGGYI